MMIRYQRVSLYLIIQCSHDENFKFLNRKDDGTTAIQLANPKTAEYQVVRTSLLPGILKTLNSNKKLPLPLKTFEVSDVGFKGESRDRRTRNERHVCATYTSKTSGFEVSYVVETCLYKYTNHFHRLSKVFWSVL